MAYLFLLLLWLLWLLSLFASTFMKRLATNAADLLVERFRRRKERSESTDLARCDPVRTDRPGPPAARPTTEALG